uniref:G_PROTEIN_RECEP_F1_2 domain-containing protein n=1 Tax=Heterorhabditis bacteriophora TaxID=37862 RepID=A0A1I7WMU7_HETBA
MNFTGNLDRDVEEWAMKNVFANDSCPSSQLPMASGTWYFVYVYIFPLQFILGVVGNALNLCVLLSRNMRSEVGNICAGMLKLIKNSLLSAISIVFLRNRRIIAKDRRFQIYSTTFQANILLAAMAIADIVLFFTILPSALGVWSPFYLSDVFRIIIYKTTTVVLYLSNVFSCMTSWLMLAVSVER